MSLLLMVWSMMSDMATELEAARLLVYQAALLRQQGKKAGKFASMAKRYATDTAMKLATEAIQIFGGYGYMKLVRDLRD